MIRMRRLRASSNLRSLVRETVVTKDDLVYPVLLKKEKILKNQLLQCLEFTSILLTGSMKNWTGW